MFRLQVMTLDKSKQDDLQLLGAGRRAGRIGGPFIGIKGMLYHGMAASIRDFAAPAAFQDIFNCAEP